MPGFLFHGAEAHLVLAIVIDSVLNPDSHLHWMQHALKEAEYAFQRGEIPVGAVVVHGGKVIGRGHNQREGLLDPTAHAEILAITAAANYLEDWRLLDCTLYVTLEPCPMCAGAILNARIPRVVFGADDPEYGACGGKIQLCRGEYLNHSTEIIGGIREFECKALLEEFFSRKRRKKS